VRDMISWLYINTDCMELLTKIPANNKGALGLVRSINGKFEFSREKVYPLADGTACDIDYYALRYADWLYTGYAMAALTSRGKWFHTKVEEQKLAMRREAEPAHADDPAHDVNVGATVEMILAGQVDKAILLYNRWARFAGYAEVRLISRLPLVVDIADAVLLIDIAARDFEVIQCR